VLHEVVTLRNSLRPVNRLPPEVLASCAAFVSDTDPRPIVPLTHICRYWRRAISSNPRNWASIATGWKRLVPLCLERAGAVPLTVDITVSDINSGEGFLESLFHHTSRIGHLRLVGYPSIEAVENNLLGFFDSPMPSLASLELEQTVEPVDIFPKKEVPTPPVFQNISNLKSLHLARTPLYPVLLSITSLRELKLEYTSLFNFGTLIKFLRSNPLLEDLVLEIRFVEDTAPASPRVSLSRLRHLSVTCSKATDSKGLLSCISLPRGVDVEVTSTLLDQSAEFGSFLPSPTTPVLGLLDPVTTIKTRVTPRELHFVGNSSTFTFRSSLSPPSNVLREFMTFPTTAVREFYANIHPWVYTVAGVSTLAESLPALETLALSNTPFPTGLLGALTKEPVLWPALKTIAFLNCDIDSVIIGSLAAAIADRRDKAGVRLFRVVIVSSTVTQLDVASVQKLRKSVPCVEIRVDDKFPDLS
jgi:hypothetical protein